MQLGESYKGIVNLQMKIKFILVTMGETIQTSPSLLVEKDTNSLT